MDEIDDLFARAEWRSVILLLKEFEGKTRYEYGDVKHLAYLALSYFRLENYKMSALYSRMLRELLDGKGNDEDVFINASVIEIHSCWQLRLRWRSYFLFRRVRMKLNTATNEELKTSWGRCFRFN